MKHTRYLESWLGLRASFWCTTTHCNTLQHTATCCNALQHTATHCNTLQHTATQWKNSLPGVIASTLGIILMHSSTLQHTVTCCNSMEHTHYLESWLGLRASFWCTTTHCNMLQHAATCCNTLQLNGTHALPWVMARTSGIILMRMSLSIGGTLLGCVTGLIHMCDMTHLLVWHDIFTRVT